MESNSFTMGPYNENFARTFIRAQFCVKVQHAPEGTDLTGKVCIITGATAGLGYHAARHLLGLKLSHLIMPARSATKGEAVAEEFRKDFPSAKIEVWSLDMSSYPSIQAFARRVETELNRLDIVTLNAGCSRSKFGVCSSTGHNEVIQVNYLSTVLLAALLLPSLSDKSPTGTPGRLTIIGSATAYLAKVPNREQRPFLASFDDTKITPFGPSEAYASSKLLLQLSFIRLLDYVNPDKVVVNIVEPGFCKGTDLARDVNGALKVALRAFQAVAARKAEDGAWMHVYGAVVAGKESHGSFLMDWETRPFPKICHMPEGKELSDVLWRETLDELEFAGIRDLLQSFRQ
ncbi:hypothetical protein GYMLUDRAFT_37787 [Collybiopsis luxurians FD-317 M1]|nr:hypothetical protein GYMLUDRAFT_37787 [Collybiopsis luxurians FD-317 M1]